MSSTKITDLTNSTNIDGYLKKVYLNTMQRTAYNDTRFTELIRAETIPGGGNHIVHFASTQRAEGVGGIAEGGSWVTNVPIKGKQMTENVKYMNAYFALSGPVIDAANEGRKSAINVVKDTVRTNITAYKNNFDRMLMGNQSGYCGRVSSVSSGTSITITNSSFAQAPYFADMFMPVGAIFECGAFDSGGLDSNGHNTVNAANGTDFYVKSRISQDLANGTSVMEIADSAGTVYAEAGDYDVASGDYFFRKGAYGTASAGSGAVTWANNREINGIANLVSDGSSNSETYGNWKYIWGKDRTLLWYLQSLVKNFSNLRLTETNLTAMMMDLKFSRQATPNLLLTTPKMENMYFNENKDNRRFNNLGPMNFVGGYTRLGIQLGDYKLILTSLGSCPSGTLFVINTQDYAFCENRPMHWRLGDGGGALVQSHTGDNQFATMVHYVNFVCFNPYTQGKGYGVAES